MAFRLPTRLPQRQLAHTGAPQPSSLEIRSAVAKPQNPHQQHHHHPQQQQEQQQQEQEQQQHEVEESTEWVLFSPSQAGSTTARTHTTSTAKTPRTAGLSQVSDFGSLDSPQSQSEDDELDDDQLEDDTAELDSLDDGLHAFREPSGYRMISTEAAPHDSAILPTHDGLGMFAPSSQDVQDQLWQHEQHNPRRRREGKHRRRSSEQKQLETMEEIQAREIEYDRWRRIEQWEDGNQSRALLQEFEKETRWRRNSRAGHAGERLVARQALGSGTWEIDLETNARELSAQEARSSQAGELQDDDGGAGAAAADDESFWRRITRKVIQDLIGIDQSLLSVILGESLVPEQREQDGRSTLNDLSDTTSNRLHEPLNMGGVMTAVDDTPRTGDYWHERLLERIARELGILVHQLCEHPGAFSTYVRSSASISKHSRRPIPLKLRSHLRTSRLEREREYWERELDVKMVFHFLRNRFIRNIPFTSDNEKNTSSLRRSSATALSTFPIDEQDPSHRAAIIRQHHPLVAHAHARSQSQSQRSIARQQAQRSSTSVSGSSVAGPISPLLRHRIRHPSSSCTSQNARMPVVSGKRTMAGGSGSSRHYWDIGGSVGSGSVVVSAVGGTGTWVDV
ncbi:conserved hypothetical protein [Histoplasma capsulatum H143]|uniref:Uncharacterized protein n=1 Tax=Ajellomyces capsulatus (strain H143) TaxID=544712 RepID=C6HJH6_AJECH|nr:conserved hypothetical protein [Histoplasma capsulatum H143]